MATLIGTVTKVIGQVFAVGGDGSRRALVEGDRVFAGEQLDTGASGAVAVHLNNGNELTLGRDSSLKLSPDLLAGHAPHVDAPEAVTPSESQLTDVQKLQQAIAAGADPTADAEATAAGPTVTTNTPGGAAGGGHSFVLLSEVGGSVDPVIGYPTAGFGGVPELATQDVLPQPNTNAQDTTPVVVTPVDNGVTINGLSVQAGEVNVNEANLPLGSASNAAALTQTNSFTVNAPDGLSNLNVGGINVLTNGVLTGLGQSITTGLGNTLTITGYNNGQVTYTYTLDGNESQPAGNGANTISESIPVTATDSNGSTATGTIDVNVTDDVPQAINDLNPIAATEQHLVLTGNVLTNDIQGADRIPITGTSGPITPGTYTGTYGTLVLTADGNYTYTLNSSDPDFVALHGGGNGTETFTYTLNDSDGDTSTATLTLNINNINDPVLITGLNADGAAATVYESGLAQGSAPGIAAVSQSGFFTVTANDGLQTLTVGGINVVTNGVGISSPVSITTADNNTLTITSYNPVTGQVGYTYNLNGADHHPDVQGSNTIGENFAVVATDSDGSTATSSLNVSIVDDVPQAVNDTPSAVADEQHLVLTGNVLTNDIQGADRIPITGTSGPITPGTYTGTYGTLVLAADGSYTYTLSSSDADFVALHGGGKGTETFTYTLNDADGDTSTATLTLNISNINDQVYINGLDVSGGEQTVYEKNLGDGSNPSASALTQTGTFTINAADGLQTLTVGGVNIVTGGVVTGVGQVITTALGQQLTITNLNLTTGVVSYSYTLADNIQHPLGQGANDKVDHISVVATDTDGSTASASLDVNIIDDTPKAVADTTYVVEGGTVVGNVLVNDHPSADGPSAFGAVIGVRAGGFTDLPAVGGVGSSITGLYGTLTITANGDAVYHSTPNSVTPPGAYDVFTYTVADADGDLSTTTVTIGIADSGLMAVTDRDVTVYEKDLDTVQDHNDLAPGTVTGSTPWLNVETATGTLVGSVTGGTGALSYSLVGATNGNLTGMYGQIHLNSDGSYTYTLTSAPHTTPAANDFNNTISTETFTYQATDANGNTVTSTIVINIVDDLPTAHPDSAHIVEGQTVQGNVLLNDVSGADGFYGVVGVKAGSDTSQPVIGGVNTVINGQYGQLVILADGTSAYHAYANSVTHGNVSDVFTYSVADGDGDISTTTVTIKISDAGLQACDVNGVTVFEAALDLNKDHNDLAAGTVTGSHPDSTAETASGTVAGSVTGGVGALTYSLVGATNGNLTGTYGQIHLNTDGSYTYTLTSAPHVGPGASLGTTESFTLVTTDSLGNTVTSELTVRIVDDKPTAYPDYAHIVEGQTVQGNVLQNDVSGADGFYGVVGVKAGGDTSHSVIGGVGSVINGLYGQLVILADGTSAYHANANSVNHGTVSDVFTYSVADQDGDISTTTVTIKIGDAGLQACDVNGVTVFEAALDLNKDHNDLAAGTVTGSHPDSTAETASGSVAGSVTGGVGALTYSLVGATNGDLTGTYGQIHLNADGTYTYTLTSAPHVGPGASPGTTESFTLVTTDSVGNSITSELTVRIVDDKPTAYPDAAHIYEGQTVQGNVLQNDVSGADGFYGVVGVKAGGDTSHSVIGGVGSVINGLYGQLVILADGTSAYHANANSVSHGTVSDVFTYSVADQDGDISTTTVTIKISDTGLQACDVHGVTVFEAALDLNQDHNDLAPGTVVGSHPDSTGETASGSVAGSINGGAGPITYSLEGATNGTLAGQYGTLHLNSDGSYTYTLTSAPKTTPGANNGADLTHETFTYQGTDALGNSISSQLTINIADDVPKAAPIEQGATVSGINTNLLLVIDISGSMNEASGVGGSRLDLAKSAIATLLDKYDSLGDVKVQVVTFNSSVNVPSSVWVDVATAKAYIAGLHADSGTNYDYALSGAVKAFETNGKIEGAQNVSYFFSDGNPTLSDTNPKTGHGQSGSETNPDKGDGIDLTEAQAWANYLTANDIKSYAIGLGTHVNSQYLDPIAYDGVAQVDTNSTVVTNLGDLNAVLSGTVQGVALTGSLLAHSTLGADGGFIKAIQIDGVTYTYDPKANNGEGGMTTAGGTSHGSFDTSTNSISVASSHGGTLVVNMDSGAYSYTSAANGTTVAIKETVGFVLADNDGDLSNPATLTINLTPNTAPVAVADHVITNILSSTIIVPSDGLVANDTDANGDQLTVTNVGFDTGWAPKGADFTSASLQTILFNGTGNTTANQVKSIDRSDFNANTGNMTALLVVSGFLGAVAFGSNANASDSITVHLKAGETLNLSDASNSHLDLSWKLGNGSSTDLGDGGAIHATTDGDYTIHVSHAAGYTGATAYTLDMAVNYAGAADYTPNLPATYTVSDGHGGSDTAAALITYQAGHTLTGTSGDDILLGDDSGNTLIGKGGHDFMMGGAGNDTFIGGTAPGDVTTVSYHNAKGPVTVDLRIETAQDTGGAGHDTLHNIQNLIASDYGDHLTGNDQANVLSGGLGNDVLVGGGGNDTLIGSFGNNTLTGGAGEDTFKYGPNNAGHDTITDFSPGTDKLDLSQLLQGENANATSLDDYLHFTVTGAGAGLVSSISVSVTAGAAPTQTIDLQGVNLASHYGVTPGAGGVVSAHDTATIINGMLGDHSLKVDTV